jgi:hypothetical protein
MVLSPEFLNNFRPEDSSEQSPKIVVFIVFSLFVAGGVFGAIFLPVVILFPFIALFVLLFTPALQVGVFDDYIFYGLFTTVIGKLIKAGVVMLVLFWCFSSITEIQRIYALRNIEPDTIQLIKFSNGQRTENMEITDMKIIDEIRQALQFTLPYSPNHEAVKLKWNVQIVFKSGKKIDSQLRKVTKVYPILILNGYIYQTPQLHHALELIGISPATGRL